MITFKTLLLLVLLPSISSFLVSSNQEPRFLQQNYVFNVSEMAAVATSIGVVSAVTKSAGTILYSLTDNSDAFTIDRYTGILSTRRILDREIRDVYLLTVSATVTDGKSSSANVTIHVLDVNDNAPVFERNSYKFAIKSNAALGSLVGRVRATDADIGLSGMVTYSLHLTGDSPFTVDKSNGAIRLTKYPGQQIYLGQVLASDTGIPSLSAAASLEIDIETTASSPTPMFSSNNYTFSVYENQMMGTKIGKVTVITNSTLPINYSLADHTDTFIIDTHTGIITTSRILDREDVNVYHLIVSASVGNGNTLVTSVIISVLDQNDYAPAFETNNYTFTIPSIIPVGYVFGEAHAFDPDEGINGQIQYALQFPDINPFSINTFNGLIAVTEKPMLKHYAGTITATDLGKPRLTGTASIDIIVRNVGKTGHSKKFTKK